MRRGLVVLAAAALLLGYSKFVWQTGFDQGADVSLCIIASAQRFGNLAHGLDKSDPACQRAKEGESNPLWILRRRTPIGDGK